MTRLIKLVGNALAAVLLVCQVSVAQSAKIVVRDVRFVGELGTSEKELQEYTEFIKGHPLDESKVLKQSAYAVRTALQHHGFLKAQITPTILDTHASGTGKDDRVLELTIQSGIQYRVNDISFSGLGSQFPPEELRETISLRKGDVADANEIEAGLAALSHLFKREEKDYMAITETIFDEPSHTVFFILDIKKRPSGVTVPQ